MKRLRNILLFVLLILTLILLYGVFIEPRMIDRKDEIAVIPNLPTPWEGKRVAVISDFQVGMWMANTGTIRRISLQLVDEQPEVILILGDFVYHPVQDRDGEIQTVLDLLQPLTEDNIPIYAVLGNHDYGMSGEMDAVLEQAANRVRNALQSAGVVVLENQAVCMELDGQINDGGDLEKACLYLVGVGPKYPDKDHAEAAVGSLSPEEPRIVMLHNPDSFPKLPANTAPLVVAGHTHGGQIRIPFFPEWSWLALISDDDVHVDGWIDGFGEPGNHLYVNRGIGFSLIPVRFACPPEITFFTLRSR